MTVIKYPLPDGTELIREIVTPYATGWGDYTFPLSDTWTRKGQIECCTASAQALMDAGAITGVDFSRSGQITASLVERIEAGSDRHTELIARAAEFRRDNELALDYECTTITRNPARVDYWHNLGTR